MTLQHLRREDGSWDGLVRQWTDECAEFDEDFDEYALGAIDVLESLIEEDLPASRARVVSLIDDGRHRLVCQANRADIKGYDGKVLRIRHIVLSPRFDFGSVDVAEYALVLTSLFAHVLKLSDVDMKAPHIKFHLRSPADRQFFAMLSQHLGAGNHFRHIAMRGSWLYITK